MNKRQARLALIVKILLNNSIGSQDELMELLERNNCIVTQATLSRDLKTLRTSKVATELGGYRYVIAANGTAADEVATQAMDTVRQAAILSVAFSGRDKDPQRICRRRGLRHRRTVVRRDSRHYRRRRHRFCSDKRQGHTPSGLRHAVGNHPAVNHGGRPPLLRGSLTTIYPQPE